MTTFQEKVRGIVRKIPAGSVLTYTDIAKAAGNPKAARAVANVMAKNFDPTIPCHRVIRSDGRPGGYNRGGESAKRRLLEAEGVVLLPDE
jgi:methylated-DNA-[protein]-cysteine S-methyltransferase